MTLLLKRFQIKSLTLIICLIMLIFASGCQEQSQGNPSQKTSVKATPDKEMSQADTLNVAEMWEISGLDPAKEGTFIKEKAMVVETLVESDPSFKLIPGLAKSWQFKSDTVWEFTLRDHVQFHNQKPLTAKSVVESLNRALKINPTIKELTKIQSVKESGNLTVEITTETIFPALPAMLVHADTAIMSMDSKMNEKGVVIHPIGTGPYVLKEWKKAEHKVILARNEHYWGKKAKIKNIVYRSIPDPATRSLEIQKASVDFIADAPYGDLQLLEKKGFKVVKASTARVYMLNFGKIVGTPFEDVNVRKALSYAVNRDEIVKYILFGMGKSAAGAFEDNMVFANKELKPHAFDISRAKELLKKAGWLDTDNDGIVEKAGKKFETTLYTYPQRPGLKPIAMALQQQFTKIGIKTKVRIMDWSAIEKTMSEGDMRLSAFSTAMIPDPDYFCRRTFYQNGNYNLWGYNNNKVNELIDKAATLKDEQKRFEIYKDIQSQVYEDLPVIMVSYYGVNVVMNPKVKNFVFNPIAHDYMLNTDMYIKQ